MTAPGFGPRWGGLPIEIVATSFVVDVGEKDLPEHEWFLAQPCCPDVPAELQCS